MNRYLYRDILNKIKPEIEKAIAFLEGRLNQIKTSRPSPALVENIGINYYGKKLLLKEVASISLSGTRQLLIQPWDKEIILEIEKAILDSGINLNPIVEKEVIRISFPPLNEEFRQELLKTVNKELDNTRLVVRRWRDEAWRLIQKEFREGKMREDDKFRAKEELQKMIDEYNGKIEDLGKRKKEEIEG